MQQLYRVLDEHKARADVVLLAAAKKKARQLQYEVRWVAVSQYYHYYLHQKMTNSSAEATTYLEQGAVHDGNYY